MEIIIPPSEGKEIKELLGDFGLKKEDKTPFWSRSKPPKDKSGSQPVQNESSQGGRLQKLLKGLFLILPLGLSLTSFVLAHESLYLMKHAYQDKQPVKEVTSHSIDQSADVFCRYFISSYFSKNNLEDYLSKGFGIEGLEQDIGTPVSVLLENQKEKGEQIEVTYVISLRSDDENIVSKRLKLTVKAHQEAKYGYLIMQKPILSAYP